MEYIISKDKFTNEEDTKLSSLIQDWLDEGKQIDGTDYLNQKEYFSGGRVTLSQTYAYYFPVAFSLADVIQEYNLSYFLKKSPRLIKCGVGISPEIDGRIEVWVFYTS